MFYTHSNRPGRVVQPKTNKFEPEYEERTDAKTGKKYLKKVSETNVYDKIQENKDTNNLKKLLDRYGVKPEDVATNIKEFLAGIEASPINDYTGLPKTLMESLALEEEAQSIYKRTPKEIKAMFNNNFSEFLQGAYNGKLKEIVKLYTKEELKVVQPQNEPLRPINTQPGQTTMTMPGVLPGQTSITMPGGTNNA